MHNSIMRKSIKIGFLALACAAIPTFAQTAPQETSTTASQPGLVNKTSTVRASAVVTAIDKTTRKVTLKNGTGKVFDVVASSDVRNFDQIKVGDTLNVEYVKSLTLELKKAGTADTDQAGVATASARAEPGEKPGAAVAGAVTIVADVVDVNPEQKTITLKGPKGNVVELDVKNPDQFKVVKKGDHVMVTYAEAMAITMEPAAKKEKK